MTGPCRAAIALALLATGAGSAAAQSADSTLAAACAGGAGVAEGLLLVVFGSEVSAAERAAIAREVGGRFAGSTAEGEYLVLSETGPPPDAAADRLIQKAGVQSVGGAACPPPPGPAAPADTAARTDTTAAPAPAGTGGALPAPADTAGGPGAAAPGQPPPDTARAP